MEHPSRSRDHTAVRGQDTFYELLTVIIEEIGNRKEVI